MKDKRKSRRRPMRYAATIALEDTSQRRCSLSDISETGARIELQAAETVPDRFMLLLSGNGAARRLCRVVWRQPALIGVTFERPLAAADRATLVPSLEPDPQFIGTDETA